MIKIPDENNLKEAKFVFAHSFRGFSLWLAGSKAGTSWWKVHGTGKPLSSWQPGSRKRVKTERGQGQV